MANWCSFNMRIVGLPEQVEDIRMMMLDYELPKHFWRVFSFNEYNREQRGEEVAVDFYGDCAWSMYVCMTDRPMSYASRYKSEGKSTSLDAEARIRGLKIEAYSTEPGCEFAEHFLFTDDTCLIETRDYGEPMYSPEEYESFEDFKEQCGVDESVREEDLVDGEWIAVGGFGDWEFSI